MSDHPSKSWSVHVDAGCRLFLHPFLPTLYYCSDCSCVPGSHAHFPRLPISGQFVSFIPDCRWTCMRLNVMTCEQPFLLRWSPLAYYPAHKTSLQCRINFSLKLQFYGSLTHEQLRFTFVQHLHSSSTVNALSSMTTKATPAPNTHAHINSFFPCCARNSLANGFTTSKKNLFSLQLPRTKTRD